MQRFSSLRIRSVVLASCWLLAAGRGLAQTAESDGLRAEAGKAMQRAADYYRGQVASHGGYVYFYSLDLGQRWGEGRATADQIWIQPPGTPTVGMAYLRAYEATGDARYLDAATESAVAVAHGQLESGGWTNCVDFDPRGERVAQYRNGLGRGKNNSSLDDGQTQAAIRLLVQVDGAHGFRHQPIHESAGVALNALLAAQFANGGFPQVWKGPVSSELGDPNLRASYPSYDWRTEGRIKNYWDMYTLNDNVCGAVAAALIDAHRVYGQPRYLQALKKLGDFLVLAQMPEPQPGWAQQYNLRMQPIWARKFEPPAVAGDETQEAIETLLTICEVTGDRKFLEPIPRALAYLRRSRLADGRLARYYELQSNRPLYMSRRGDRYSLTYDDANLPQHYGWKWPARLEELQSRYERVLRSERPLRGEAGEPPGPTPQTVRKIVETLDEQGRWVSAYAGERLVGQPKFQVGERYLSSELFSRNLTTLSRFVGAR